ncbi:class I SAM-dependent methyltransferase [Stappia indica]|uniref:class I SAM-dependent methyltransferase n=1 Tax=Stappia indica TaxID=538381 RepID=UPI0014958445|nr:class I SAM-dependent methyltransferase [Stappia indica]
MRDQIARHLEISNGQNVLAALTPSGRQRYGDLLRREFYNQSNFHVCDLQETASTAEKLKPTVVVLVAGSLAESRDGYSKLHEVKKTGVPVVFALAERTLTRSSPDWQKSGVQYEGMFYLASQYCATILPRRGAYCEFGVYDGRSFIMAGHALRNVCGKFFAYDSYQGIGGTLKEETTHFGNGMYEANVQTLHYNIEYSGLSDLNYQVIPGFFEKTLRNRTTRDDGIGPISVVHIDTDVYEPALLALEYVSPDLSNGALLMFDDFDQLAADNSLGERRALREWLSNHPEYEVEPYRNYGIFCRSFIVHRVK